MNNRKDGDEIHPWVRLTNMMIEVGDEENMLIALEHSSVATQLTDSVSRPFSLWNIRKLEDTVESPLLEQYSSLEQYSWSLEAILKLFLLFIRIAL